MNDGEDIIIVSDTVILGTTRVVFVPLCKRALLVHNIALIVLVMSLLKHNTHAIRVSLGYH